MGLPSQALPLPEAAVVKVYSSWPTSVQVDLSAVLSTQSTSGISAVEQHADAEVVSEDGG